jgi:hypothetical protein
VAKTEFVAFRVAPELKHELQRITDDRQRALSQVRETLLYEGVDRLWTRRFADPLADTETFRINAAGQLLEIGGKTTRIEDIEGQYVGLLKFTPSAWSAAELLLSTLDAQIRDRLDVTGLCADS